MGMDEEILGLGYINSDQEHVMVSLRNPSLLNCPPHIAGGPRLLQFALTIENADSLRNQLDEFLEDHSERACEGQGR